MIGRGRNLSETRDVIRLRPRGAQALRLDRYLKDALAWRSRTRIQRLIRAGRVTVNGRAVKPSWSVRRGDEIVVRLSQGTGRPDYASWKIDILYEDAWLVAVNKPPGLLVHPVGRHVYDTLMNFLHYRYRAAMERARAPRRRGRRGRPERAAAASGVHPSLCHRIDRDTTGIVLVGKERYARRSAQRQFERRQVKKLYLALVHGRLPADLDAIDRPLAPGRTLEACLDGDGAKPSRTRVRVIEEIAGADGEVYSWIAAVPLSGRQNQIRIHLAACGHPLVGDTRFGRGPAPAGFPQRFILHARRLRFWHPRLKSVVDLRAPLPADVRALLRRLRGP